MFLANYQIQEPSTFIIHAKSIIFKITSDYSHPGAWRKVYNASR